MPELAWRPFKHSLVEFPRPNKIDRFVHKDGDREIKLLSLSLQYLCSKVINWGQKLEHFLFVIALNSL